MSSSDTTPGSGGSPQTKGYSLILTTQAGSGSGLRGSKLATEHLVRLPLASAMVAVKCLSPWYSMKLYGPMARV